MHEDYLYNEAVERVTSMLFPKGEEGGSKSGEMDEETKSIVSAAVKNAAVWYKATENVINDKLNGLAIKAVDSNGNIASTSLSDSDRTFLNRYVKSNEEWEELSIVVGHNGDGIKTEKGESVALTINRPLSVGISESLTRLILVGSYATEENQKDAEQKDDEGPEDDHGYLNRMYDEDFYQRFKEAFGEEVRLDDERSELPKDALYDKLTIPTTCRFAPRRRVSRT